MFLLIPFLTWNTHKDVKMTFNSHEEYISVKKAALFIRLQRLHKFYQEKIFILPWIHQY